MDLNTIFDYLEWRGDMTLLESPVNEVDSLIFCAFAYFRIESVLSSLESISIKELYHRYQKVMEENIFTKNQNRLFKFLSESKRFQSVLVTHFFHIVDKEIDMQISGMTFVLPNNCLYVAFKGTDDTITGWKEDFDLSYKHVIPSQKKAVSYLNEILSSSVKPVYVGGHSKGGNLAMYASLFCKESDLIVKVYNYDGPGFSKNILETDNYQKRKEKIVTFIPSASIVGNIFDKDTKTFIIKSKQIGVLQHDLYSWLVLQNHFVYTKEMSNHAKNISNALNQALLRIPNEDKKRVISFLYELLESWNVENIEKTALTILEKYNFQPKDFTFLHPLFSLVKEIQKK